MVAPNRIAATSIDDDERRAAFARVFAQHDRWLYAYLMTLLGNPAHAEEVFQEVCVVLWREYAKFDLSTNFMKWASVIALNQVRKFRRTSRRHASWLTDSVIDVLSAEAIEKADLLGARRQALQGCLAKLNASDREVVGAIYGEEKVTMKDAAEQLGRPANTVYKAMSRIRRVLHDCISRRLAQEGIV